jgi:hypothetical protein
LQSGCASHCHADSDHRHSMPVTFYERKAA